jgi:hypothetical protein
MHCGVMMDRHRRFHTRDADEARAFLSNKEYEIRLPRAGARQIDLRINGVYMPSSYLGYYQYGTPVMARTHTGRHDYWINLPLENPIEATIGAETLVCALSRGLSPRRRWSTWFALRVAGPASTCRSWKNA